MCATHRRHCASAIGCVDRLSPDIMMFGYLNAFEDVNVGHQAPCEEGHLWAGRRLRPRDSTLSQTSIRGWLAEP